MSKLTSKRSSFLHFKNFSYPLPGLAEISSMERVVMHFVLITNLGKFENITLSSFSHHVQAKTMVTTNTTAREN